MKKITLIMFLMMFSFGFSQNAPINFESGGYGGSWTWTSFENGANASLQIVANPNASGANTSAMVAKLTPLVTGAPWAGCESSHGSGIGTFTLSASNSTVKIMVYKSVISDVGIKFANSTNGSTGELKVANTLTNQWEELTFNFSSKIGETNDQIIIFPDFQTRTSDNICYFDNITFSSQGAPLSDPLLAAPTPTRPAANVISMFSNAYTNVAVDTWRTGWSAATLTEVQIVGNDTKKYSSLDFVGVETMATKVDASAMLYMHVDVWTPNMTAFRVKLVNFGTTQTESELSFTPTLAGWNSYEIPLSDFNSLSSRSQLGQLIFSGNPSGSGVVYIDNVYFHNVPLIDPNTPMVAAPTPTRPAANVISMFSNAYTNVAVDTWRTGWSSATFADVQIAGNDTKKYSGLDFVGVETMATKVDASGMTYFHIDAWTPNMTTFRVKLVDFGTTQTESELSFTPTQSGWNSYDILMSDFTSLASRSQLGQLIFSGNPTGSGIVFIDNVYFSNIALGLADFEVSKIKMYPNPTANNFTIEAANNMENVSVYNLLGQEMVSANPNLDRITLDISNFQEGVYILKVTIGGKVSTSRIIKK